MKKRLTAAVLAAFIGFAFLFAQGPVQKVRLWDTDLSHPLLFQWDENDNTARTLNFLVAAGTRSFTISGDSYINQDVRTTFSPTWAGAYLTSSSAAPFLKLTNSSDTARDPVVQFAVGATPVTKFTMGVDDSDGDSFKLSAGSAPGTTDILRITSAYWVGLNESSNVNMTAGLTINQGAADDEILAFKSSDVYNGLDVEWVESDTYAQFLKIAGATGGLDVRGYGEGATGLQLEGFIWDASEDYAAKSSASLGIINLFARAVAVNPSSEGAPHAGTNLVTIRCGIPPATVWLVDVEGDSWQPGTVTGTQLISTIADGDPPLVVDSTTEVANLNVNYLQGNLASAFEPALGNPDVTGYVLSSTDAGVRSWIEMTGGAPPESTAITQEVVLCVNSYRDSINKSTTYYFTANPNFLLGTDESEAGGIRIPITGTIKRAWILWNSTGITGSDEGISIYYRQGESDTLIATVGDLNRQKYFVNDALSIAVNAGAYFNMKVVTPNWGTIPSYIKIHGYIYIEGPGMTFLSLPDTPDSYVDQAGLGVRVNSTEDALEFYDTTHNHDANYISIIGSPAANHFPYQTAGGELINSAYDASDFAAAGHNHSGTYEPALGNPGTSGFVLSSTDAGVRSWVAKPETFIALTDTPAAYAGSGGYVVKVKGDASGLEFVAGGAGVSSFNDLDDVPASYVGQGGLFAKVKSTEDGLEFAAGGGGGAPADAQYVTLAVDGDLSDERVLTAGTGIKLTDAGAGSTITAAADPDVVHRQDWIHEHFDGLNTATIIGQGSYNEAGAWIDDGMAAGSTAEVTVKAGADKMLTIMNKGAAGATSSYISSMITTRTFLNGGGSVHVKAKINQDGSGYGGRFLTIMDGAGGVGSQPFSLYFRYSTTFQIAYWNGTGVKIKDCSKDTWYTIDAYWGPTGSVSGAVTVFIDGAWAYKGALGTMSTKWDRVSISSYSPAGGADCVMNVDDLIVTSLQPLDLSY